MDPVLAIIDSELPDPRPPKPGYPRAQAAIRDALHAVTALVDVINADRPFTAADVVEPLDLFVSATRDMLELRGITRSGDPSRPLMSTTDADLLRAVKQWGARFVDRKTEAPPGDATRDARARSGSGAPADA